MAKAPKGCCKELSFTPTFHTLSEGHNNLASCQLSHSSNSKLLHQNRGKQKARCNAVLKFVHSPAKAGFVE
jgi:hypothetical protein